MAKVRLKHFVPRVNPYLDVTWLKNKSLADLDNLPDAGVLAEEIAENLESALAFLREIMAQRLDYQVLVICNFTPTSVH